MTAKQDVGQPHGMPKDDPGFRRKPGVTPSGWETKRLPAILINVEASERILSVLMARRVAAVLARASIQGDQQVPSTQTGPQVRPAGMGPTQENKDGKAS